MPGDLRAVGTADIVVTGANGFIGAAVVRELVTRGMGPRLRVLVRRPAPGWMTDAGVEVWRGDLTAPTGLVGLCAGITTLVHLASQVGGDEARCVAVNVDGTGNLLAEARRAGTANLSYLSTCGVYRDGVHRGALEPVRSAEGEVPEADPGLIADPASATSRSRLAAERLVRAAGGVVLRPHLVHGAGDRHVVPALVRWLSAVPAWAAGGTARTSLVAVTDLAAAIATLALRPGVARPGDVFHVADPHPVRLRLLLAAVCGLFDLPLPVANLTLAEHQARTRLALPALSDHQYSLLTRDHWYESSRIWALTGESPGPGYVLRLAEAADWYRESLGMRRAAA